MEKISRIVVLPQTIEIMKEIEKNISYISPMDLSWDNSVRRNDFLLCRWEFENSLLPRDKIKIVYKCPMKSGSGIISSFEESIIDLMCDSEMEDCVVFKTREGDLEIPVESCPIPLELREFPYKMSESSYASWRSYLFEFYEALKKFQWFKKSKL